MLATPSLEPRTVTTPGTTFWSTYFCIFSRIAASFWLSNSAAATQPARRHAIPQTRLVTRWRRFMMEFLLSGCDDWRSCNAEPLATIKHGRRRQCKSDGERVCIADAETLANWECGNRQRFANWNR